MRGWSKKLRDQTSAATGGANTVFDPFSGFLWSLDADHTILLAAQLAIIDKKVLQFREQAS
jgi:hypothetical protein